MAVNAKLPCRVEKIYNHGDRVYTIELIPERNVPRFSPGQFLHLAIDPYDPSSFWPDSRAFSIASSPVLRNRIRITYSVVGSFTSRMEQELREGKQVWVKLPYGEFLIQNNNDNVLLAGGTGVTAFTAYLESLTDKADHTVMLFYGARKRELLIYRSAVDEAVKRCSDLKAYYFIEEASDTDSLGPNEQEGRLSIDRIIPRINNPKEVAFYLSGPPKMLADLSEELKAYGVSTNSIHIDAW